MLTKQMLIYKLKSSYKRHVSTIKKQKNNGNTLQPHLSLSPRQVIKGKRGITFIMDDPAGNNYVQNLYAPDDDPQLTIEEYERTYEQNEELGLNDMKTENYEEEATVIPPPQTS